MFFFQKKTRKLTKIVIIERWVDKWGLETVMTSSEMKIIKNVRKLPDTTLSYAYLPYSIDKSCGQGLDESVEYFWGKLSAESRIFFN